MGGQIRSRQCEDVVEATTFVGIHVDFSGKTPFSSDEARRGRPGLPTAPPHAHPYVKTLTWEPRRLSLSCKPISPPETSREPRQGLEPRIQAEALIFTGGGWAQEGHGVKACLCFWSFGFSSSPPRRGSRRNSIEGFHLRGWFFPPSLQQVLQLKAMVLCIDGLAAWGKKVLSQFGTRKIALDDSGVRSEYKVVRRKRKNADDSVRSKPAPSRFNTGETQCPDSPNPSCPSSPSSPSSPAWTSAHSPRVAPQTCPVTGSCASNGAGCPLKHGTVWANPYPGYVHGRRPAMCKHGCQPSMKPHGDETPLARLLREAKEFQAEWGIWLKRHPEIVGRNMV